MILRFNAINALKMPLSRLVFQIVAFYLESILFAASILISQRDAGRIQSRNGPV